ncbi:hypothetical protein ACFL2V_03420 [Pseudomonadota bacterium]
MTQVKKNPRRVKTGQGQPIRDRGQPPPSVRPAKCGGGRSRSQGYGRGTGGRGGWRQGTVA